jgi:predicted O-methyltransferase YrrM
MENNRNWHTLDTCNLLAAFLLFSAICVGWRAPVRTLAQDSERPEARAEARLAWMRAHQTGMWNVAPSEGAFLRDEVVKVKAKRALEIGTSNGYSGIWVSLGLVKTGGRLLTLEINQERANLAQENFHAAGVDSLVTLKLGDALEEVPKLEGPFEFVFIDAAKQDYVRYLQMVVPLVTSGGVIVAHNVTDLRSSLGDFIQAVKTDPRLKTTFENPGPGGFSVSVKLPPR